MRPPILKQIVTKQIPQRPDGSPLEVLLVLLRSHRRLHLQIVVAHACVWAGWKTLQGVREERWKNS